MKILNVKGCTDYLPNEQLTRNNINQIIKETFEEFCYLPIETPILTYYEVLSGKYDTNNDILKEIYKLSDQGKRELGLRYDLTVPFAKFIALNKNKISFPFKRYEISKVFRDGPIKLGRDREFTQCDADVVGLEGQMIEAECLILYVNAIKKLGIDIEIQYNNRHLMKGLILDSGIQEENINSTVTILDKMEKLNPEELKKLLYENNITEKQISTLMSSFKLSLKELTKKYKDSKIEELRLGIEELSNLEKYIEELNIRDKCIFTPTLARGQDYYTSTVFEVYEKSRKIKGSIGGGGRYDNMITEFINDGTTYPAVGISFGLSSIYELLKDEYSIQNNNPIMLYIIPMSTEIESMQLADKLRNYGIKVLVEMKKKKITKALNWANKSNIPYVIVLGENELNTKTIKVRNMKESKDIECNIDNIEEITKIIK